MSKGERTRATIVDAAVTETAVRGLRGISIGGLADLLGMSKSGLFRHFGSKEALQQAVLEELIERFRQEVVVPALSKKDGCERMEVLFDRFLGWMAHRDRPGGCPIMAVCHELDDQPGPLRDYVVQQMRLWMGVVTRVASKCVEQGGFRPDVDPRQFAFEVEAIGHGFNFARQTLRDPEAENRARDAFRRLMDAART
jgi:AcrR family transcriptional regulator